MIVVATPLRATVDTNVVSPEIMDELLRKAEAAEIELAVVTVTLREKGASRDEEVVSAIRETAVWGESPWGEAVWGGPPAVVAETFVLDESLLDEGLLAADDNQLEPILRIISNGAFPRPGKRDDLTRGQRRQLRDAMIIEAHAREGRDIFVTDDTTGFVKHGRQESLEALCSTRIMTLPEFEHLCDVRTSANSEQTRGTREGAENDTR